ncbi:uncharacterized protein LOC131625935 [Vicia villosa]|uniref:uncharacterized protein LOC131625935 n=1 Tax=Vicia villosa TaxID=3911 RepID=UPI00273C2D0B|nr:uncharacterized protein LOC131625935 [Vicia villosa]
MWRIGNGEKVVAKRDKWIPTVAGLKVVGQMRNSDPDVRVSNFIDSELGMWRTDLMRQTFEADEAEHILGIPLSRRNVVDKQVWHHEKSGAYFVKTAYHVCIRDKEAKEPGPSNPPSQELWKKVWNAPIHTRIKHFLWRLACNILPTKTNLQKKGIALEETCGLCHQGNESTNHLFTQRDFARRVFFASVLGYHSNGTNDTNALLFEMLSNCNVFFVQVSCYLLHHIWKARNLRLYQQKDVDPVKVAMEARYAVMELNHHNPSWAKNKNPESVENGSASAVGFHTVRVDDGLGENDVVTFGCVILDDEEKPVISLCKKQVLRSNPSLAEDLALRWSMETTISLKLSKVIFQSDAKKLVDCVNEVTTHVCLELVAEDCRSHLKSFSIASIVFIPRKLNSKAHALAQLAKSVGSKTWLGVCPIVDSPSPVL